MVSVPDLQSPWNLSRTSAGYSFALSTSNWNGFFRDEKNNEYYFFDKDTKAPLTRSSYFVGALSAWQNYSAFSFHEDNTSPNIIAYHADTNSNLPTEHDGVLREAITGGFDFNGGTYVKAEIAMDESINLSTPRGYWTALHEIGHALGLRHPKGNPNDSNYNTDITVMSYNVPGGRYAVTPMALDVKAIEEKYGSTSFESGPSTYAFVDNSNFTGTFSGKNRSQTIMDTGGTDHFDFSAYTGNNLRIDLRRSLDETGTWHGHHTRVDQEHIYIAHNTHIENATAGQGDDILIGNSGDNVLDGGPGHDTVRYDHIKTPITVTFNDLSHATATGVDIGTDTLISIENLIGGSGPEDTLDLRFLNEQSGGAVRLDEKNGRVTIDGVPGFELRFQGFEHVILDNQGNDRFFTEQVR